MPASTQAACWLAQAGSAAEERIRQNFEILRLPDDAMQKIRIRDHIATSVRFNAVVDTGVPGFVPPS